jgi:hypothetical protein
MTKLKLGSLVNDKPVKLSIELPPSVHRDLVAYAEVLARETGQSIAEPAKLIAPMLERFMATDRGLCESAADVVIDSRVTSLGTCVAQAPE